MLLGNLCRLVMQAAYFLLIARNLGVRQYGGFVAITSATALLYPFVANGCGRTMIRSIARDPAGTRAYFGKALATTAVMGAVLGLIALGLAIVAFGKLLLLSTIVTIVISDFVVFRFTELAAYMFQAHDDLRFTSAIAVGTTAMRLLGIIAVVVLHRPSLAAYSLSYLVTSAIASVISLWIAIARFGVPQLSLPSSWQEAKDNLLFSTGVVAETVYNDIDKSMLGRLGSLESAGIYAAAARLIEVAFVPVRSLLAATYSSFFRAGRTGLASSLQFCRRYLLISVIYGVAAALTMFAAAPMIPRILGSEFTLSASAVRWMAAVLVIRATHSIAADVLVGADYQGTRTAVQSIVAVFNVIINIPLIRNYSWRGAAWSTVASETLLAALLWGAVIFLLRRQRTATTYSANLSFSAGTVK